MAKIYPASRQIAEKLKDEIISGKFILGQKLPTETELCERFKVSRGTIRPALEFLARHRLIIKRQGKGSFVSNPKYSQAATIQKHLIGALVSDREHNFFGKILKAAGVTANSMGYGFLTGTNDSKTEEANVTESFLRNKLSGLIMTPHGLDSLETYKKFIARSIPIVFIDSIIPGHHEDFIDADNVKGIDLVCEHLISLGHKKVAYIGKIKEDYVPCRKERLMAFKNFMEEKDINIPKKWIITSNNDTVEKATSRLLTSSLKPTAIIAYNDLIATKIINTARDMGLRVPEDLSVTGFDDSTLAHNFDIPLTSVSSEQEEMGTLATNLLISKIENPTPRPKVKILVDLHLEVRSSTAPLQKG